ncbi:hypothetical protein F5B22DRAFT_650156 [Xylaria bambusicola]|uniref:uncharacterized protein n=1 Tax=Xylaria bambusicola TaxID=326684 RepID=UPI002008B7BE|nr:uncharacterized protein F5B22DRAFT_650156 [Xylaria bambusicola]KAI0508302.1 hypothetical protein F5B22DRAFT_650156 [Xylaria bambusicola]
MRNTTGATATSLFTALIRTHHITSRKKLQRVKKAASQHQLPFVLIRSGGSPGIMYAEGAETSVNAWVSFVRSLRYKDFQCPRKPAENSVLVPAHTTLGSFEEVTSITEFGHRMEQRGLGSWWKLAMGYSSPD